jgi:hypothetical protein
MVTACGVFCDTPKQNRRSGWCVDPLHSDVSHQANPERSGRWAFDPTTYPKRSTGA